MKITKKLRCHNPCPISLPTHIMAIRTWHKQLQSFDIQREHKKAHWSSRARPNCIIYWAVSQRSGSFIPRCRCRAWCPLHQHDYVSLSSARPEKNTASSSSLARQQLQTKRQAIRWHFISSDPQSSSGVSISKRNRPHLASSLPGVFIKMARGHRSSTLLYVP